MKIIGLDVGDVWTGVAITDALGLFARPFTTVKAVDLIPFLQEHIQKEQIKKIIMGYPITMRGTQSEQTKKVLAIKETLEKTFPNILFILQDERLTSKQAAELGHARSKQDKIKSHARAAAFILSNYLAFARR